MWRLNCPYVWKPNATTATDFHFETPLNDPCNTPRGQARLAMLERSKDKWPWMHNRKNMEVFNDTQRGSIGNAIKADKDKGKTLRKLIKRQRK